MSTKVKAANNCTPKALAAANRLEVALQKLLGNRAYQSSVLQISTGSTSLGMSNINLLLRKFVALQRVESAILTISQPRFPRLAGLLSDFVYNSRAMFGIRQPSPTLRGLHSWLGKTAGARVWISVRRNGMVERPNAVGKSPDRYHEFTTLSPETPSFIEVDRE